MSTRTEHGTTGVAFSAGGRDEVDPTADPAAAAGVAVSLDRLADNLREPASGA